MIYVLCPADVKTGGTELLHQLVKTLTDVKVPAGMVILRYQKNILA